MDRLCRSGATLLFGAGLGAAASRLLSVTGRKEEEERASLLNWVPVIPVPTVQASDLTVSVCAAHRITQKSVERGRDVVTSTPVKTWHWVVPQVTRCGAVQQILCLLIGSSSTV